MLQTFVCYSLQHLKPHSNLNNELIGLYTPSPHKPKQQRIQTLRIECILYITQYYSLLFPHQLFLTRPQQTPPTTAAPSNNFQSMWLKPPKRQHHIMTAKQTHGKANLINFCIFFIVTNKFSVGLSAYVSALPHHACLLLFLLFSAASQEILRA